MSSHKYGNSCLKVGARPYLLSMARRLWTFLLKYIASRDATHLMLSAGGNDSLLNAGILERPVSSTAHAVEALADVSQECEEKYRRAVAACKQLRLPLTLSTIYNGCIPNAEYQRLASTALMVFNDVILRSE